MACLQIYREWLSFTTFLWVHSDSKVVCYLSWQNTYPNLKTNCHIKLKKFFLKSTPRKLTPCKISHVCRCAFESYIFWKFIQYTMHLGKTQMLNIFFGQNERYKKCNLFSFASSNSSQSYFSFAILIWAEAHGSFF